jgi:hypothetical protein
MAILNTFLANTSPTIVFASTGQAVISTVYVCNHSVGNVAVDIHAIPGGISSADANNVIYSNYLVTSSDTLVLDTERLIVDINDELVVTCNVGNAVTVTVSSFAM